MLADLFDHILSAPAWLVLVIVGTLVFSEDALFVGFVLPGETAAILGGVAANRGHVDLPVVMAVVVVAAIVGDSVGFEVGLRLGPRILEARILQRHRPRIEDAQKFLVRRGGWAVLLGRWVAFFRAVMPALAGLSKMRYRTFLLFNATGGILWGAAVVTAGYLAGASYAAVEKALGRDSAAVAAIIVVLAVIIWKVREHRRESSQERPGRGTSAETTTEPSS